MNLQEFKAIVAHRPETLEFAEVIELIHSLYLYAPAKFRNGNVENEAGSNEGSCKIFAFAKLQGLTQLQTLHCFGEYYRIDVLEHPDASDHGNIRQFMEHSWAGVEFESEALTPR